ncbi:MAG: amidohydrolase family protein [Planctomycetes bacterium]|nr:amidohydrolase family protein [Planctomycetota bacterium]
MMSTSPRTPRRTRTLCLAALLAALTVDLSAQGRGRRGQRGDAPPPAPAPAAKAAESEPSKPKHYTAIVGGDVYLGTGQRVTGATVLIADDKIEAIGQGLTLPEGTTVLDAKGKIVSPGFVAVVGNGMGAGRSAPFADGVNPFDPEIKQGLAAGITAFLAGSVGSSSSPSGSNAVVKLAWGDAKGMVLKEDAVLGIAAELSLGDRDKLAESVKKAQEYLKAVEDFPAQKAKDPNAKEPAVPPGTDKILAVLRGQSVLWISLGGGGFGMFGGGRGGGGGRADDLDAIRQGLDTARLFGRGVVLQKPVSAWLLPDEIAATGSMVFLSPRDRRPADPQDPDRTGSNLASAAILARAGVPVAVTCPVGMFGGAGVGTGGILGQDLNTPQVDAAFAVRGGMDNRKALRTITLDAAKMLGVERRIGSLEPGKDADVLILDGDPLHYATFVTTALVNGKVVYEKANEPLFRHITR